MGLAEFNTTILDGALGLSNQDLTAISAAVGVSSSGALNTPTLYSRPQDVKTDHGTGPLVEKGCFHLVDSQRPLYLGRINASVVGTISAIAKSNMASPTITASGSPLDTYQVSFEIMQTGTVGSATSSGALRWTVDDGDAYSPEYAIPVGGTATAAAYTGSVNLTTLTYAGPAVHTGTQDLTVGGLYGGGGTLDGLSFNYTPVPGVLVTVTLTAPANAAAVISQINAQLGATIASNVGDRLRLTSVAIGAANGFILADGGGGALAALGLTAATYNGTAGDLDGLGFSGTITSIGPIVVAFGVPANAAAVVSEINADVGSTVASLNGSNQLVLTSTDTGAAAAVTRTAGAALAVLGLAVGTTNGNSPPATYTIPGTGITLSLPYGTYTEGDTYTFTTTEPNYSLSDLQDALDAFLADAQKQWFVMHVIGATASAAAARAMADLLDTYAADAEALHRFTYFVMETPESASKADLKTQFATFESRRVGVNYGYCELTSEATRDLQKRVFTRPSVWAIVARWAAIPISEKAAFVGRGRLTRVQRVEQAVLDSAEEMADARFLCLREVIGKSGFYVAEDVLMAPVGSDFTLVPYRRIMDTACRIVRERGLNYLQGKLLVDPATGFIRENVAQRIETDIGGLLRSQLVDAGHASSAVLVVARNEDILSTQTLNMETRVVPPAYAHTINHTIGFLNPATS